ncbi:hypothetical protein TYRP_003556 [Tyrophagus putrescentiae]|nr:hypothetical protein TYRP_003556 [Tyrophagus putrescentiae]
MNSNSKNTSSGHPRIIRSRTGATNAAGWLSASTQPPSNNNTSSGEPSDVVYLEVMEDIASKTSKLLKCQRKAAMMSTLLADMLLQDSILSGRTVGECGAPVLPLTNDYCSAAAIERVIAYCEYHCDDPRGATTVSSVIPTTTTTTNSIINSNSYRSFDETMDDDRGNGGGGGSGGVSSGGGGGDHQQAEESKLEIACYWDRSFIEAVVANGSSSSMSPTTSSTTSSSSSSSANNLLGLNCPENRAALYDLLVAAHYLGIDRLVELGAKYICRQITGKSCEEVRALLNIRADLLEPAEERRLHEENAVWASDLRASAETSTASALAKAKKK